MSTGEKLQLLLMRFIIGSLPKKSPVRNALVVQKAWSRYTAKMAAANEHTAASLFQEKDAAVVAEPASTSAVVSEAAKLNVVLEEEDAHLSPEQARVPRHGSVPLPFFLRRCDCGPCMRRSLRRRRCFACTRKCTPDDMHQHKTMTAKGQNTKR